MISNFNINPFASIINYFRPQQHSELKFTDMREDPCNEKPIEIKLLDLSEAARSARMQSKINKAAKQLIPTTQTEKRYHENLSDIADTFYNFTTVMGKIQLNKHDKAPQSDCYFVVKTENESQGLIVEARVREYRCKIVGVDLVTNDVEEYNEAIAILNKARAILENSDFKENVLPFLEENQIEMNENFS